METLNLDEYFVQRGIVELPHGLKGILARIIEDIETGASKGRAPDDYENYTTGNINLVPSKHKGGCHNILVGICYDKDNFEERIRDWLDHTMRCPGINGDLYFFTTQWNSLVVQKFKGYIDSLRKNGLSIHMIYITDKGFVLMPI